MNTFYAKAFAKVNLSLDICGRREDGYHLLESVMQEISLGDDLSATYADTITISCNLSYIPTGENNIIQKVARAFFAATGMEGKGAHFTLHKRIPSGAGLGGGSADGVAALRLLNQMYETHLTREQMVDIVAPIGADLPFFVYGKTALAQGIGELVTPLTPLSKGAFLLVKPDLSMSTPTIYGVLDQLPQVQHPDTQAIMQAVEQEDLRALGKAMGNSLQDAGMRDYSFIAPLREQLLSAGALGAMLSGSGSTVYGLFEDVAQAKKAALALIGPRRSCYVVTPVWK